MSVAARPCTVPGVNPELWFADKGSPERAEAVALCKSCPFRADCAASGLSEEFGVWGGMEPENLSRQRVVRARLRSELIAERQRTHARILAMTEDGLSKSEIVDALGVSYVTVTRVRRGYSHTRPMTDAA